MVVWFTAGSFEVPFGKDIYLVPEVEGGSVALQIAILIWLRCLSKAHHFLCLFPLGINHGISFHTKHGFGIFFNYPLPLDLWKKLSIVVTVDSDLQHGWKLMKSFRIVANNRPLPWYVAVDGHWTCNRLLLWFTPLLSIFIFVHINAIYFCSR